MFALFLFVQDRVSLGIFDWLGTHFVDQSGLELTGHFCLPACRVKKHVTPLPCALLGVLIEFTLSVNS